MEQKRKILVICGPTATGKTALGIKLAKKFNGEIISADSRQVYKGMDIGTGKDLPTIAFKRCHLVQGGTLTKEYRIGFYEIDEIKVWLYDIVKPDYQFSVADYVACANLVIDDIYKRGKLPIIVGGSGLYIKGLIDGIGTMGIEPDWELRKKLSNCSITELLKFLKKLNPKKLESMNNSDRNNPRRLIRAIELAKSNSLPQHTVLKQKTEALWFGLMASSDELYQRIDQRVEERIKIGVEEEIKKLLNNDFTFENSAMGTTIGYKEFRHAEFSSASERILKRVQDDARNEIIQRWKFAEHAYARRQMTWFKKEKRIHWFEIEKRDWRQAVEEEVGKWYNDTYSSSKARSPKDSSRLCLEQ